jgi:pantothenate kinase-related protein Tda10
MLYSVRKGSESTYTLNMDELYQLLDDHNALVDRVDMRFFAGTASPELKQLMIEVLDNYQTSYVPKTKLALVIFTAISGSEFYIQD